MYLYGYQASVVGIERNDSGNMAKKNVEDVVAELAQPIIEALAFELVDVEFLKEGANWYLRVYIDKPGGIAIDDCQAVSEHLSDKLDEADPIKQSYMLEVSSPGERPLKKDRDYERFKGERVEIKLYQPLNGRKVFEGELLGLVGERVDIKTDECALMSFDRKDTALVRRIVRF
jgi:ribosome maturation factor RimP